MLAFGLKIAWFTLSLTGLLSSLAAVPAFAYSLDGYLIPIFYGITNCMLQGLFCLGMIWEMNPLAMPRAFCIVQPALMSVSWSILTALTTCMTIATSLAVLRPAGGIPACPAYIRRNVRWRPAHLLLLIIFPLAALVAYLALSLRFNAVQPVDGLSCDVTMPVWIRLLSYAGVPLLLALPSFLLTCAAAYRFYTHSPRSILSFSHSRSNDHFTPVPLRRQSKLKPNYSWHEAKGQHEEFAPAVAAPLQPVQSLDGRSTTPSGTLVVEAIPSPPSSLSSAGAHLIAGRVPISPGAVKPGTRYHLPFHWRPPSIPLTERSRQSPDYSSRHTPSPLVFAVPADEAGQPPITATVSITPDPSDRMYEAAPWLKDEKAYLRQLERANAWKKNEIEAHDDDDNYDAVSGSLRWVRRSSDDTASIAKSELEFARTPQREEYEETTRRPSPADPSTYDAGLSDPPIPNVARMVWRILFFQLFSSVTQILATVTPLVDMFAQHNPPAAFGTQHIALLFVAWAPPLAFGIIPWRRKSC
ncbi:hypothetical protein C8Q79DRAFT_667144 [Trametes meyenii]|nr:hypothetical protein C8Q79DRAFT_667144 [Trametes meyenii]